jgi:hypothetical protein
MKSSIFLIPTALSSIHDIDIYIHILLIWKADDANSTTAP